MRRLIQSLAFAGTLCFAGVACAAPTCLLADGVAAKCGANGAMPVGWRPTREQMRSLAQARPPDDVGFEVVGALCLIAALATIIAMMPDFDGWEAGDWDEEEGDNRRPG